MVGFLPLGSSAAVASAVQGENALPGTHAWYPLYPPIGAAGVIEGYASEVSVDSGDLLQLHVSTNPAASYRVDVYRLGYYQGLGGRLLACLPSCFSSDQGQTQVFSGPDPVTGEVRESWPVTDSITVPSSWVSGYYVAKLVLTSGPYAGKTATVPFIVRAPSGSSPTPILVVSSVDTEQAYNGWGGKSLYSINSSGGIPATHVSFDRPYGGTGQVYFFELPFVSFLESQGLDVSYTADVDVDKDPAELLRHRLIIVNGHDEYWSKGMRDGYEAARDSGVNLAFWGGNIGDWQIRYQNNWRTIVGYKNSPDPYPDPTQLTTNFSKLVPSRPQCQLLGTQFGGGQGYIQGYTVTAAGAAYPWFAGTGLQAGSSFPGNNFEYDLAAPKGCLPYQGTTLFTDSTRSYLAPAFVYTAPSGATVFSVGSFALSMVGTTDPAVKLFALNAINSLSTGTTPPPTLPINTAQPTITGTAAQGSILTGAAGSWTGTPTPSLQHQWMRCNTSGGNCTAIPGAAALAYLVTPGDIGFTIRLNETATNTAGSAAVSSDQTAVVTAAGGLGPTTPLLDNFNRPNGIVGSTWSPLRPSGFATMAIFGNAAVDSSTTAFAANFWNTTSYGPDSEAYARINTWGLNDSIRIGARITNPGTTSASGYYVQISLNGTWTILRVDAGPSTTLATGPTQPLASGDQIAIRIIGNRITALHYTPSGGWTQILSYDTASDATRYTNAGRIAIQFKTSIVDDFGGGTI
jgi:hypothetical protein